MPVNDQISVIKCRWETTIPRFSTGRHLYRFYPRVPTISRTKHLDNNYSILWAIEMAISQAAMCRITETRKLFSLNDCTSLEARRIKLSQYSLLLLTAAAHCCSRTVLLTATAHCCCPLLLTYCAAHCYCSLLLSNAAVHYCSRTAAAHCYCPSRGGTQIY